MNKEEAKDFLTHYICCCQYGTSPTSCGDDKCKFGMAVKILCREEPTDKWIPIITRNLDNEGIEELVKNSDRAIDEIEPWCYDCKLPDDYQKVIISTPRGVTVARFCTDDYYGCYFDGYEDRGDVIAWMPLPEPYKGEEQ